jgi:magnesium transporter
VIKVIVNNHATGTAEVLGVEDLKELVGQQSATLWVDVTDPTPEEVTRIGDELGFHPLALEDTIRGGQRPKIDPYEGYQFIVFYGLTSDNSRIASHEVDIFVAKHFLVSVHRSGLPAIEETAARWHANVAALGNRGAGFLLYCLLDSLVDGYFPVLDDVSERADSLEEMIILRGQPALQAQILQLRRDLLMIRRVAGPERDVLNVLIRRDPPLYSGKEIVYFQDVYDHLLRITDSVDIYRDMLASVLDANLSMVSYNLNVLVKRLTSFSIILMSMSLIAGVYGMNFVFMPELDWRLGYPFALGLMAAIAVAEVALFRRIGWL